MNDKVIGFFEMISYERNIDNIFAQATRFVKSYTEAHNDQCDYDEYWLDDVIRYINKEYESLLPNRLNIYEKVTTLFLSIKTILLYDNKSLLNKDKKYHRLLNKLIFISKLIIINPDYNIQKVDPFGIFIDIMKRQNHKEFNLSNIEKVSFQLYEISHVNEMYEKYINIFEMRYGYLISYIVDMVLKEINMSTCITRNNYKLAVWIVINSAL